MHEIDAEFVSVKNRVKALVKCIDDIKGIDGNDIDFIFKARQWECTTPEENMVKLMDFCLLEFVDHCVPVNKANAGLVNFF